MLAADIREMNGVQRLHRAFSHLGLMGIVGIGQAICAFFFFGDVISDIEQAGFTPHLNLELACNVLLVVGSALAFREIRKSYARAKNAELSRLFLSGAFGRILQERSDSWKLTPAESEIALFLVKGYDPDEIARYRGTATSTVRAQLTCIYRKSGCSGRGQFVSGFIDALIDVPHASH